ncbi:MAG TPA: UvrB/UvrC motif-containing protein [Chthoniobacterales bacterium]
MLCDVCKHNQATVFLTQIVDGKMQKANLCESCSKEKGVTDPTGFALADLLKNMGGAEQIEFATPVEQRCPTCGFTQADFKKTGRLGCSDCYATFHDGLDPLLKTMHKGTRHVGKVPARQYRELELSSRLKDLRDGLQRSVAEEDYELAAKLRDEIRTLETQVSAST